MANWNSPTVITNCIAWADSAIFYDDEILVDGTILPIVRFSDIDQDGFGMHLDGEATAEDNFRLDPLFVDGPLGFFYLLVIWHSLR